MERNMTRRNAKALAGDDQETHGAAGTWAVSQKRSVYVMNRQ